MKKPITKYSDDNDVITKIRNRTSLEIMFKIGLMMADYNSWENGEYLGDMELIKDQVEICLRDVEEWKENKFINPIRTDENIKRELGRK